MDINERDLLEMYSSLTVAKLELKNFNADGTGPLIISKRIVSIKYIEREIDRVKTKFEGILSSILIGK